MEQTVLHFLEDTYNRQKEQTAVFDDIHRFTYQELRRNALKIANYILEWNCRKRGIIVLSERDARCVVMFWGILYSGNFYVPINYKANKGVFREMLDKIRPAGILCCDEDEEIKELCDERNIKYACFGQMVSGQTEYGIPDIRILESDPAYMVFTSGSTGIPKGIIKSHHSVVSFVNSFFNVFSIQQENVFGNQAGFDYDVAAKDIYLSAAAGAGLGIIPGKCFLMPVKLMQYLQKWKISTLVWAAAAVRLVAKSGALEKYYKKLQINKVFFSGEELAQKELCPWVHFLPDVLYVNLYAPSEVTGNCLYYKVDNQHIPSKLPLGVPFDNTEILLLNEDMKPVGENEEGEICVRGPFLSMGYYADLEQTREKFIQNPMHNDYIDYIYRTGDIAKYDKGGLYFLGRKDYQIKFMGHRIELFEIESVFMNISKVSECCCVLVNPELVMFYKKPVDTGDVIKRMKDILPKYKIPRKFIGVQDFPRNARGKIDRKELVKEYKESKDGKRDTGNIKGNQGRS